jgi:hypothetical protein
VLHKDINEQSTINDYIFMCYMKHIHVLRVDVDEQQPTTTSLCIALNILISYIIYPIYVLHEICLCFT